jgi:predicted nucleic acid-binding protein
LPPLHDSQLFITSVGKPPLPFRGTQGVLLDAKRAGIVPAISPLLDRLKLLGVRASHHTYLGVLELAGENP